MWRLGIRRRSWREASVLKDADKPHLPTFPLPGVLDAEAIQSFVVLLLLYLPVLSIAAPFVYYMHHVAVQSLSSPVLSVPVADGTPKCEDIFVAERLDM